MSKRFGEHNGSRLAATVSYYSFFSVFPLHLVSRIVLLAAELNAVLALDLSPRSLLRDGEPTDADRKAILLDVQRIQRDPRFGYAMAVGDDVASEAEPAGEPATQVDTSR